MAFRIHVTNQAIRQLDILPGTPPQLVVWSRRDRAYLYDLDDGTFLDEMLLDMPTVIDRSSDVWGRFIAQTKSSKSPYYLPCIRVGALEMLTTDDGALRFYRQSDDRLFIDSEGHVDELRLVGGERLIQWDLDRALGTLVGLDETLKLHIYQQGIRVGAFDIGLARDPALRASVAIARGAGAIYATDGQQLVHVDNGGRVHKTLTTHYDIGQMACAPNGGMVVTSDLESGVLRAYRGEGLVLTHQKFAIDLVADANQVQLLADLPPIGTATNALTAYNRGVIAFAMSGVVCVTDVKRMDEIPRPRPLL
ncbi:MAG: hypothetical protein ACFE0Q_00115 [Anaerolineae bacterium]